jgi:hypothetical protein
MATLASQMINRPRRRGSQSGEVCAYAPGCSHQSGQVAPLMGALASQVINPAASVRFAERGEDLCPCRRPLSSAQVEPPRHRQVAALPLQMLAYRCPALGRTLMSRAT